jgi:hypothetical protein
MLIAPNAVLTARHCFQGHWPKKASIHRDEKGEEDFLVPRAALHPTADLAVAFLEGRSSGDPLPLISSRPTVGKWMTAVGFGCVSVPVAPRPGQEVTCNGKFASRLKALPLQRVTGCGALPTSKFCVSGGAGSLGPGDSGGPVLFQLPDGRWQVAGVVANAITYRPPYRAGITSTAELRTWIQAQLAPPSRSPSPPGPSAPSVPAMPTTPAVPTPTPGTPPAGPVTPTEFYYSVYGTCADGACGLRVRSGPGYSGFPQIGRLSDGDGIAIVCQTTGETVGPSPTTGNSSAIWDRLSSGGYVSDLYVTTPAIGQFTPGIPSC